MNLHEIWMQQALKEAEKAYHEKEVPVGAVVVCEDRVIGKGYNQTETLQDPTAHAEMIAISAAANTCKSWRLDNCILYVTLEPCAMCAGAIVLARIDTLVFGSFDPKAGACSSLRNIVQDHRLNHVVNVVPGILEDQTSLMLKTFFQNLRNTKRKQKINFN
ncbi:nucleoside deaminase [bacterium]|nr:nucleoside deaminase [bacterium]RQV99055.1 MAG: nucleoside deaminase [bacterium]